TPGLNRSRAAQAQAMSSGNSSSAARIQRQASSLETDSEDDSAAAAICREEADDSSLCVCRSIRGSFRRLALAVGFAEQSQSCPIPRIIGEPVSRRKSSVRGTNLIQAMSTT